MEWRKQTSLSCTDAFIEAQHWIEEVTGKTFDCKDFRAALENGVLLCDLLNQLKPGIIKRVNRLSTPIAGLDNVSVFLKACGKLGLNESQLFHPGDLQDLSTRVTLKRDEGNRRIKNVLITIYWLGRKAHQDLFYQGPQLNLKYFEGLLGLALSRQKDQHMRPGYKRYSSVDSVASPEAKTRTFNSEGCGSDAEAEQVFKKESPHLSPQSNKRYLPPPLQKVKRVQGEKGCTSPLSRSKSLSDIPMVYPVHKVLEEALDETLQPSPTYLNLKSNVTKDTEAQWHDDFTKWKNRRRSSKCEVYRTSLDREHVINQMTNGANVQRATSQTGPIKRDQHSPGSHPYSTSPTKSSKPHLRPHTRALLARSYATEMPYNAQSCSSQAHIQGPTVGAMPAPDMNSEQENLVASLASVGAAATTPSMEFPYSSQSHVKNRPGSVQPVSQNMADCFRGSSVLPKEMSKLNAATEGLTLVNRAETDARNDPVLNNCEKQESKGLGFDKYLSRSGTWSGSASLPRGYSRSEGTSRLSAAITARPFGTKPSRVSSLPRLCNVEDSQLNWPSSDDKNVSPPITLLKRQTAIVHLKGRPPLKHSEPGAQQEKENCAGFYNVVQSNGFNPQPIVQTLSKPQLCTALMPQLNKEPCGSAEEDHSDMRLCLTLKPNSRHDFGFQTDWDSRGARVTSIQPGSPAELCGLCINDEIIAVDGVPVTKLNFNHWKNKMSSALQTGSLTMDVRRYGNRDWSTSEASLYKQPGQLRTTLNLTSAVPLLIGRPDHHDNTDRALMALPKLNGQTNNVNLCQNMDGAQTDIPRTDTNKGGSESAISDLQVPSLSPSSCSSSWDREEERRRQEKWQEEQERLLQEKYQRDQERLEAEWRKAQQDASSDLKEDFKNIFEVERTSGNHQRVASHVNGLISQTQDEDVDTGKDKENSASGAEETRQKKSDDWVKSSSTPALTSPQKQMRGTGDQRKRKNQTTVSKAEQERQQILDEMKKRTQLLTDNSWIRQRSASFYKESVMPGVPIKRYESMDHLESWRNSPVASLTFTFPRPQSAAAGLCGSTKVSSGRHSTGSMPPPHRSRTDPDPERLCCVCEEVLDTGAAMVIEALSLSFHLACFQCVVCDRDLRGTETGVQVRIQNGRPYCEHCFSQLYDAAQL